MGSPGADGTLGRKLKMRRLLAERHGYAGSTVQVSQLLESFLQNAEA